MSDDDRNDPFRALKEPLGPPPTVLSSIHKGINLDDALRNYHQERARRMELLMRLHGIDPTDRRCWERLAWKLAEEHVEGLKPWKYDDDAERQFLIISQMYYLIELRGFPVIAAARAIAREFPEQGSEEAIRSAYRDSNRNMVRSMMQGLWARSDEKFGKENLAAILEDSFGRPIKALKSIDKPKRGRPRKI